MIKLIDLLKEISKATTMYHGTNIKLEDGNDIKLPFWATPDWHLASHFALNPASSSKKSDKGYVYEIEISDPTLKKIEKDRYIVEKCDNVKIIKIDSIIKDPMVFAKIIKTIKK